MMVDLDKTFRGKRGKSVPDTTSPPRVHAKSSQMYIFLSKPFSLSRDFAASPHPRTHCIRPETAKHRFLSVPRVFLEMVASQALESYNFNAWWFDHFAGVNVRPPSVTTEPSRGPEGGRAPPPPRPALASNPFSPVSGIISPHSCAPHIYVSYKFRTNATSFQHLLILTYFPPPPARMSSHPPSPLDPRPPAPLFTHLSDPPHSSPIFPTPSYLPISPGIRFLSSTYAHSRLSCPSRKWTPPPPLTLRASLPPPPSLPLSPTFLTAR